jgi:hypothetical protein
MEVSDLKKYLVNFLKSHHFPIREKNRILDEFDRSIGRNESDVSRVIDYALGWNNSIMTYDFYYFNQMRWANFVARSLSDKTLKLEANRYLKYLTRGYATAPQWKKIGDTYENALANRKNKYDLIISEKEFNDKCKFFQKLADNYKKYCE